ncbi:MAG: hypothetical protein V1897_11315 [Pseudomonadota bacterium]
MKSPSTVEPPVIAAQFEHRRLHEKNQDNGERYLPYTLGYGLRMALPTPLKNNFDFDAGYDKWLGLPTMKLDCFIPARAWNDKSVFFAPRVSTTGRNESFSVGAGIRQLITSESMIGFHAFHDWTRDRKPGTEFLRQAGFGVEFSALPGYFSDITVSANAYFPTNTRKELKNDGISLFSETLPGGADARVNVLLPNFSSWLDFRLDASAHTYSGLNYNSSGYTTGVAINSRDGSLRMRFEQRQDSGRASNFSVTAGLQLAFDWKALLDSKNPFSAPYTYSDTRYNRKIRNTLFSKVSRKLDLPQNRLEQRSTLMASVAGDTVTFTGGFPNLPYSTLTVQVSHSPWRDYSEIVTDAQGAYYGAISMPPGICRVRVLHKPTGWATPPKTVVISDFYENTSTEKSDQTPNLTSF